MNEELESLSWQAEQLEDSQMRISTLFQRSTALGFYDELGDEASAETYLEIARDQKLRMSMVFDRSAKAPSRHVTAPVHTYASFPGQLNVGGKALLQIHKITAVTVSATHRRRGILKASMHADLAFAAAQGFPLAALTASEGSIYGRYGFGIASHRVRFTLKCAGGLGLQGELPGTVQEVLAEDVAPHYRQLAADCMQRSFGSVDPTLFDEGYMLGRWDGWETLAKPKNLRWAVYRNESGHLEGLVCFKFKGWDSDTPTMEVQKLIASSPLARIGLLNFLGNHDLIEEVHAQGPVRDPLRLMLSNDRDYKIRSLDDELWLRVLDPVAALEARHYEHDGSMVLKIDDELGYASGNYEVTVRGGSATVHKVERPRESIDWVQLQVADLSRVYLGDATLADLLSVGRAKNLRVQPLRVARNFFETLNSPHSPHLF
ncbi:GNAT family N-acetyltransferase [Glutamicibacter arilaitensis]|uniref:GNAT family N-acetyltransferase n=1 Tax=Glutamicibacter arilaitensis TaxID=256701 RepID=UPI003850AA09